MSPIFRDLQLLQVVLLSLCRHFLLVYAAMVNTFTLGMAPRRGIPPPYSYLWKWVKTTTGERNAQADKGQMTLRAVISPSAHGHIMVFSEANIWDPKVFLVPSRTWEGHMLCGYTTLLHLRADIFMEQLCFGLKRPEDKASGMSYTTHTALGGRGDLLSEYHVGRRPKERITGRHKETRYGGMSSFTLT